MGFGSKIVLKLGCQNWISLARAFLGGTRLEWGNETFANQYHASFSWSLIPYLRGINQLLSRNLLEGLRESLIFAWIQKASQVFLKSINYKSRWWFRIFFYLHPYLGKWSTLTNIFQMGLKPPTIKCMLFCCWWNHTPHIETKSAGGWFSWRSRCKHSWCADHWRRCGGCCWHLWMGWSPWLPTGQPVGMMNKSRGKNHCCLAGWLLEICSFFFWCFPGLFVIK